MLQWIDFHDDVGALLQQTLEKNIIDNLEKEQP